MSEHHQLDLAAIEARLNGHSIFSPSGSAMWFNCSGSLIPHLSYPDTAGEEAAEGTVAHGVGELWLKSGKRPTHLVGTIERIEEGDKVFEIEITDVMLDYVQEYVDRCIYLEGDHFVETRVDFSDLTPIKKQTGTADHAACAKKTLTITDLKYGKGLPVYAKENTQGLLYAWGFFREYDEWYDFQDIIIRIVQPRLDNYDEWHITRAELIAWSERIKERAYAAWCQDAARTPGTKQCQWCRAKPDCAAYVVFMERLMDGVFDDLDAPITADSMARVSEEIDEGMFVPQPKPIGTLTTAQKAALLPYRKMIESWFAELAEDLERRCADGEVIPGYKLVEGRTDREFVSESKAVEHLEFLGVDPDKLFVRMMVGIGKVEDELRAVGYARKLLPELLEGIVRKPKGKPTMALESDKRPALIMGSLFENLDDEL